MEVKEIVEKWLTENGYDGLYSDGSCACENSNLMPCDEYYGDCEAGYKQPCPGPEKCCADGDCEWHIVPKKTNESEG